MYLGSFEGTIQQDITGVKMMGNVLLKCWIDYLTYGEVALNPC